MSNAIIGGWIFGGGGGWKQLGHGGVLLWLVRVIWTLMLLLKMAMRTLRTVNVYHVGISNKLWGKDNKLTLDSNSWKHSGCSWILRIAGKSLPDPIWCSEKSDHYTQNLRFVPFPFIISNRRIYRLDTMYPWVRTTQG